MRRLIFSIGSLSVISLAACGSVAQAPASTPVAAKSVVASATPTPPPSVAPSVLDAASVAADLTAVERAIRLPDTPDAAYADLGHREQRALLLLEAHPDWVPSVLNAMPASIGPSIQANLSAAQQIGTLNGVSTVLPHWKIVAPASPGTLMSDYYQAQQAYGVAWQYLAAINLIETNMGRIQGLSSAGAQGPMQFMPATWAYYGHGDVNDPHDAILAAGRYLKAHGAPADMTRAIYAYNPSMLYVRAVQLYAQQMVSEPRTFLAYYNWQVYVPTPTGNKLLPEGFSN